MVETASRRIDGARLTTFRDVFRGDLILPTEASLRRGARRLERDDRPPAGDRRPPARHRRRHRRAPVRPRRGPRRRGPQRRPQHGGPLDLRRRHRHRPRADAGRHGRSRSADRPLQRRRAARRARRCGPGVRPRLQRRDGLAHGHRRPDPRRWHGPAATQARTVDRLPRAVELVTADGRLVRASADENADLFWGMRGAGANFGIVTAFEFALQPIGPTIIRGILVYPAERARATWPRSIASTCPRHPTTSWPR